VPGEVLQPKQAWADKAAFDATARKLAGLFAKNFQQYESLASEEVKQAGPRA
jgi:phosphoenolpyruvate carboxykinase (ATP)